jgi:16S rRNA processing protein RimM
VAAAGISQTAGDTIQAVEALPDDLVEVGAIAEAYGVKGWIKIFPHAGSAESGGALLRAKVWWLVKGRDQRRVTPVTAKPHSATIVAQFAGCDDRSAAETLRGFTIHVRRADFPVLTGDEYYWVDLIGLAVVNEAGEALGTVAALIDNGAHSILRVPYSSPGKDGTPTTAERLIPFVDAYIRAVDLAGKRITVDWETDY